MNIDLGKSEVLMSSLSGRQEPLRVRLEPEELDVMSELKYLSFMVSVEDATEEKLKHRLGEGAKNMGGLVNL